MKSIIAAVTVVAALSLGACSGSEPATSNLAGNELALNEADIPVEGNAGDEYGNSTLGFDNALDNAGAGVGNDALGNDALGNEGAALNAR